MIDGTDSDPIQRLIANLTQLPGIGEKTATRLTMHILAGQKDFARSLAKSLEDVADQVRLCSQCCTFTVQDPCVFCSDQNRDDSLLCLVARPQDIDAIERTGLFQGRYHVLHGLLSPLDGIGPADLKIGELLARIRRTPVKEVILATSPSIEGEATAMYVANLLKPLGVKVTRIAAGMPIGGELEYSDSMTVGRALQDRRAI